MHPPPPGKGKRNSSGVHSNAKPRRGCAFAFPRRDAPGLCVTFHPLMKQRAQGRPGARCTRGLVCKVHKRKRTRAYRFSGGNPAFPAQWFYGLLRALPGDRLSCHRHFVRTYPTKLGASTGAPGPHDFAVRAKPRSSVAAFASTASHRAFVTCATPLSSGETGELVALICPTG